jgi:hypothetical protein
MQINKGHVMNWPPAPVRSPQSSERQEGEGPSKYKRRLWETELEVALSQITDVPTRNAMLALRHLTQF